MADWEPVGNLNTSGTLNLDGLTNSEEYRIRLRATNANGTTISSPVFGTPVGPGGSPTVDPPSISSFAIASTGTDYLIFSYQIEENNATVTSIEYEVDGSGSWISTGSLSLITNFKISGLGTNQQYSVKIRATNSEGTTESNAVIQSTQDDAVAPDAPVITGATPGDQQLSVAFTVNDGGSAITDIEYRLDGGSWVSSGDTTSPIVISGLNNGQSYSIKIRAVNAIGTSFSSNPWEEAPEEGDTAPAAPTLNSILPSDQTLELYFTLGNNGGQAITDVEYRLDGGSWISMAGITSPFSITGLTNGQEYDVEIRSENSIGFSPVSNLLSATPTVDVYSTWPAYNDPGGAVNFNVVTSVKLSNGAGLEGTITTSTGNPPSNDPNDWTEGGQDILTHQDVYGIRIHPNRMVKMENGFGVFYDTDPWGGSPPGSANNIVGSLANSAGGLVYNDYPNNPVLHETQAWQHTARVAPQALIYNPYEEVFYATYGDEDNTDQAGYYGKRAIGLAKSTDMINWTYLSDTEPLFTHLDMQEIFPAETSYNVNYQSIGRVYTPVGLFHEGYYYLAVSFSSTGQYDYHKGWIRSQNWEGPWEPFLFDDSGDRVPIENNLVQYDGKWYYANMRKNRCVIYSSNNFEGPYNAINGDEGVGLFYELDYPDDAHESAQLFMHNDVWYVIFTVWGEGVWAAYQDISPSGGIEKHRLMRLGYYDPYGNLP